MMKCFCLCDCISRSYIASMFGICSSGAMANVKKPRVCNKFARGQRAASKRGMANNEYFVCTQWSDMGQAHTLCTHTHKNKQTSNEVTMDSCASTIYPAPRPNRQKRLCEQRTRAHYKSKLTACLLSCPPPPLNNSPLVRLRSVSIAAYCAHIAQTSRNYPCRLIYTFYTIPFITWVRRTFCAPEHDPERIFNFACSAGMAKLLIAQRK